MTTLKLVFTKSKKSFPIISYAIRWISSILKHGWRGFFKLLPYSHVAREVLRKDWGSAYYQASEGKVNYEHENTFNKKHQIVKSYTLELDKQLEMEVRKACWTECGNVYGTKQNLGIPLVRMGLLKDNPWKTGRNCSELMYVKVLKKMIPELNFNPDTITPYQIEDIILNYFVEGEDNIWRLK